MEFQTQIHIPHQPLLDYHADILLMGSCFSESMGENFSRLGFRNLQNPFGILYQPAAILRALQRILRLEYYTTEELVFHDGLYHSPDHHGRFSGVDADKVIAQINQQLQAAHGVIRNKQALLMITFGSTIGYVRKEDQRPFSNCHKIPGHLFTKESESIQHLQKSWNTLLNKLQEMNPFLQVVFTVSPVRHWKEGAIENQLSKAKLLVSLHEWVHTYPFCHYFPAYEIMMDELRDYRFYKDDMLHPTTLAENIIWKKLTDAYLNSEHLPLFQQLNSLYLRINHRPLHPERPENKAEMHKIAVDLEKISAVPPFPDLQYLEKMLKQKMEKYG